MPELPDIEVYLQALRARVMGHVMLRVQIAGLLLLRTAAPPITAIEWHKVTELRRVGKRVAVGFDNGMWLVFHLMIAGRLHWRDKKIVPDGRRTLAAFDFDSGTLTLTEAGSQKRASLHLVEGEAALEKMNPGGIEVLAASREEFGAILTASNHTLKRSLADPRLFSGIGNSYSDEILFNAELSPVQLTQGMDTEQIDRLYGAVQKTLRQWTKTLSEEAGEKFPEKVTAFREGMAVHGRYQQPCRKCGTKIQRIRYASNETNYCPQCQTGGKLLADRALSRLLRKDWPKSLDEMEERIAEKKVVNLDK